MQRNKVIIFGGVAIMVFLSIVAGYMLGMSRTIENLRAEMTEKNLVFCTPVYPLFGEPYAEPANITWEDLQTWEDLKTSR